MDASKQLVDLLTWAAGRGDASIVPSRPPVTRQAVIEALSAHRLTVRFAGRLTASGLSHDFGDVVASLAGVNQRILERAELDIQTVVQLQSLGEQDRPPILLKGFTPHCLTGGAAPHHRSGDIDLLPPDTEAFKELARTQGYRTFERHIAFHEAGYLVRGDAADRDSRTLLDVHTGFPVFAPAGVVTAQRASGGRVDVDAEGRARPAMWLMIEYDDVAEEWGWVQTRFGRVAALKPEMAILIACSHMHKNIHNRAWRYPLANLPLGELADTLQVAGAVAEPGKLQALAERFHVVDAVVFAAHAADRLLGEVPAGLAWARERTLRHTRTLWADRHHPLVVERARPLEPFDNLLVREQGIQEYVRELGALEVQAPAGIDKAPAYELDDVQHPAFTHRRSLHAVGASLQVSHEDATILFHVTPHQAGNAPTHVFFNFGVPVYEVTLWPDGRLTTKDCTQGVDISDGPRAELVPRADGRCTIAVRFTAADLGVAPHPAFPSPGCALVLGVRQGVPGRDLNAATVAALDVATV
ncbi:nucleotidyltransferase family protein [Streptomyces variabilis]